MSRYIDAEAFKEHLHDIKKQVNDILPGTNIISSTSVSELVDRFPAADVVERPKEADYLLKMLECKRMGEEIGHATADGILCDLLEELGYYKVVNAFESLHKWYS